ncbi:MAG: hypothetical protein ABSA18_11925 [Dehalococcoidia bacterium]|jgi:hypothetical protein
MKSLGAFFKLIGKAINYSLDYSIKIIGVFGLLWGIYILYQFCTQKPVSPPSIGDLIQVSGAIILIFSVITTLVSSLIARSIKNEKFRQMRYIQIHKAYWIVLVIYDVIVVTILGINTFNLFVQHPMLVNQNITNILIIFGSVITALMIVVCTSSKDAKELFGHRIFFLHDKGEKLRESYIDYINALGFDNIDTKTLSANSWKQMEPENWPNIDVINKIQSNIQTQSIRFTNDVQAILSAHDKLLASVKDVANVAGTRIFSENRDLVELTSLSAYFHTSNLWIELDALSRMLPPEDRAKMTHFENQLKESAIKCGVVLIDLCKFANRMKPLLKNSLVYH